MKTFKELAEEEKLKDKVEEFIEFVQERLELEDLPEIYLIDNKEQARDNKSFGGYYPGEKVIRTNIAERHIADIFRTLAHELVHYKQDIENKLEENSGETGSDIENEANALAGVIMREYAKKSQGNIFEEKKFKKVGADEFRQAHISEVDKFIQANGMGHTKKHNFDTHAGHHTTELHYSGEKPKVVTINSQIFHRHTPNEMIGHNVFIKNKK